MQVFQQSEANTALRRFPLHLVDETDGLTPETGEAGGQPQISKNGAAFANTSATLVAIGNGAYYVELTMAELNTTGFIIVRYKSANTAEFQAAAQVVAYAPGDSAGLGLSRLDAAISSRSTLTAAQVWDYVIEATETAKGVMRLMLAALAGKSAVVTGTSSKFRDIADSKDRLVVEHDDLGNRTSVTRDSS